MILKMGKGIELMLVYQALAREEIIKQKLARWRV